MALKPKVSSAFLFMVALSSIFGASTCQVLRGEVTCLDCSPHFDFSGISVQVRCDTMKKPKTAITKENGSFKLELPRNPKPTNCLARLFGGPQQLYASRRSSVSKIIVSGPNSFAISTPLAFTISCPSSFRSQGKCGAFEAIGSSKTVDIPVPPEWGLAPTSYYVPRIPIIIGIP